MFSPLDLASFAGPSQSQWVSHGYCGVNIDEADGHGLTSNRSGFSSWARERRPSSDAALRTKTLHSRIISGQSSDQNVSADKPGLGTKGSHPYVD